MIPQNFIEDLVARTQIETIVADYVTLKRNGSDYVGLCPFHNEKTPSFHVRSVQQYYHCFGCGKGGGVINFVMEAENLDFPNAVHFLAKRAGVTVPVDKDSDSARSVATRSRTLQLLTETARFYHELLKSSREGLAYLEKRRLTWRTAVRFGIGFAPDDWSVLTSEMKRRGYSELELNNAGLISGGKNGRFYDKFRNRLMFPVIDQKGQVIAFGGRILGDAEPKYLNSPEIPNVFSKGHVLFGINLAKNTKRGYFILCEGNIDVISMHQAGFDNTVASMGTSLTDRQVSLIAQMKIGEVVICYDADGAGIKATDRAMAMLAEKNIKLSVVRVPDGKDVDDFLKANGELAAQRFEEVLESRKNDVNYKLDRLEGEFDLTQDDQRVAYLRRAIELLATFDAVQREVAAAKVADRAKVAAEFVSAETAKAVKKLYIQRKRGDERAVAQPARSFNDSVRQTGVRYANQKSAIAEEGIIRILMLHAELIADLKIMPEEFSAPELARILAAILARGSTNPASLQSELMPEDMALVARISSEREENLTNSRDILADYIAAVRREKLLATGNLADLIAAKNEQLG